MQRLSCGHVLRTALFALALACALLACGCATQQPTGEASSSAAQSAAEAGAYVSGTSFSPAGLDGQEQAAVQADPQWLEFATKMKALYDHVEETVDDPTACALPSMRMGWTDGSPVSSA